MDNIQDIIVFLFIAFSIISSILKKKKKKENAGKQPARPSAKKPAFNLEELLGLPQPTDRQKKEAISEVDAYFLQNKPEEKPARMRMGNEKQNYADIREKKIEELERRKNEETHYDEIRKNKIKELEKRKGEKTNYAEIREEKLKELERRKREDAMKYRSAKALALKSGQNDSGFMNKLTNASSLREYIIVNEILGKPLALRD
ncbi:MAG: hypothetical protein GXO87_14250 [Chlorobi bacterium]|nr:hypothetical protein [Chlorobiota bacterium]